MTTTTVLGRIVMLVGACSIAVTFAVVAGILLTEARDWLLAVRKRQNRQAEVEVRRLPSGRHAQIVRSGSLTVPDSFMDEWEGRLNRVYAGPEND